MGDEADSDSALGAVMMSDAVDGERGEASASRVRSGDLNGFDSVGAALRRGRLL